MPLVKNERGVSQKPELKIFIDSFKELFNELSSTASVSSDLLDCSIEDSFAKFSKDFLNNPVKYNFDALIMIEKSIHETIHQSIVLKHFETYKALIKHAYKVQGTGNLLYYVVLYNDNTLENRSQLNKLILDYDKSPLKLRFPIVFQDIPNELVQKFKQETSSNPGKYHLVV